MGFDEYLDEKIPNWRTHLDNENLDKLYYMYKQYCNNKIELEIITNRTRTPERKENWDDYIDKTEKRIKSLEEKLEQTIETIKKNMPLERKLSLEETIDALVKKRKAQYERSIDEEKKLF